MERATVTQQNAAWMDAVTPLLDVFVTKTPNQLALGGLGRRFRGRPHRGSRLLGRCRGGRSRLCGGRGLGFVCRELHAQPGSCDWTLTLDEWLVYSRRAT